MKRFSFVIPTYNSKVMLKYSLEALNNQLGYTSEDYEVIVVDDGSEDNTWDYIKGTNKNYELQYIYIRREPCSSRARARNYGWKSAQGQIVVFIDADIIVKPTHLSELDRFYTYEKDLVVLGTRLMLPRGTIIDFDTLFEIYDFNRKKLTLMDSTYFIYDLLSYNICVFSTPGIFFSTCNSSVPREYLEAVNGFDENYIGWGCEDMDIGCRLHALKNLKFAANSRLECLHQYHKRVATLNEEYEENKMKFQKKFLNVPGYLPISEELGIWNVLTLPKAEFLERFAGKQPGEKNKTVLEFRNREDTNGLKEKIMLLSDQEGLDIEVYDYCEDTNLDLWIQLLGVRKSTPQYFPVSRRIGNISPEQKLKYWSNRKENW